MQSIRETKNKSNALSMTLCASHSFDRRSPRPYFLRSISTMGRSQSLLNPLVMLFKLETVPVRILNKVMTSKNSKSLARPSQSSDERLRSLLSYLPTPILPLPRRLIQLLLMESFPQQILPLHQQTGRSSSPTPKSQLNPQNSLRTTRSLCIKIHKESDLYFVDDKKNPSAKGTVASLERVQALVTAGNPGLIYEKETRVKEVDGVPMG